MLITVEIPDEIAARNQTFEKVFVDTKVRGAQTLSKASLIHRPHCCRRTQTPIFPMTLSVAGLVPAFHEGHPADTKLFRTNSCLSANGELSNVRMLPGRAPAKDLHHARKRRRTADQAAGRVRTLRMICSPVRCRVRRRS